MRIAISGYGNLGRGVEAAVRQNDDMELAAVFTRRDPASVKIRTAGVPVVPVSEAEAWKDKVDVLILCGGSATDLPKQTPEYAKHFHVVDSFDNHAHIPEHFAAVHQAAQSSNHVAVISVGWDPGLFSLARVYANAVLPEGRDYTFWGRGVSQGHSDAIRRVPGVRNAKQYTVPVPAALDAVRSGQNPELTTREKHTRECYVVLEEGADAAAVEKAIKTMPDYFEPYDTTVHFISEEELEAKHAGLPHAGVVFRTGVTGFDKEYHHVIEYSLKLDSNPEFTTSVLIAYARAAHRLAAEGAKGAKTVFDIPPAYLCRQSGEELRAHLL
ncbi:diaminopimelate dehydrogenase [Selenomonas sp. TAMA-11512]|uniref:diaminopimelate dehydrogenase n=1 Tax=Selenomonas sp. TAMA-11512 TaxID=3095337 RepID=UPI00308D8F22|nr:diaminopimelate dehydrogenase [Selenomonas sp. TAMA-11512]